MGIENFKQEITLTFRHGDPAGIMFFGNAFPLAHDVCENFITHLGFAWAEWFDNPNWAVPIRHAEADYFKPLLPSERYTVTVFIERIGESSFTIKYVFSKGETVHCEVKTVHAFINQKRMAKIPIPPDVRVKLEAYQRKSIVQK